MISIRIDSFEFEDPGTEEMVEIDICRRSRRPCPDVNAFVAATVGSQAVASLAEPKTFHAVARRQEISEYIKRFANIEIPPHVDWLTYQLDEGEWDQTHMVICAPGMFIRYCWSTTA